MGFYSDGGSLSLPDGHLRSNGMDGYWENGGE
jgi:hypothetical protein